MAMVLLLAGPTKAFAVGEVPLDLADGSVVITSTGYSQNGALEVSNTNGYIFTNSTANSNTIQVTSGTHVIILDSAVISVPATTATAATLINEVCAFSLMGSSNVTLTLQGNNTATSAAGYAGIYVETGSQLTINGSGSLTATGGAGRPVISGTPAYGGGAGIGGNGYTTSHNFGTVTVDEGTLTLTGGVTSLNVNYGAGAGLGSGGANFSYSDAEGSIIINGGTITAQGKSTAAGIGGGANTSSFGDISIMDADVQAYGSGETPTATTVFGGLPASTGEINDSFTMPASDVTVRALFEPNLYTVTFERNGGSAVSSQTVPFGGTVTEPPVPTREGYTFAGWYTDDGTFLNAWDFANGVVEGDLSLYASWIRVEPIEPTEPTEPTELPTGSSTDTSSGGSLSQTGDNNNVAPLFALLCITLVSAGFLFWAVRRNKI